MALATRGWLGVLFVVTDGTSTLLQVVARHGGEWKVVAYHSVDVKAGVPVPKPK